MAVARPQTAIFALGTRSHHHLQVDLRPDADPAAVLDAVRHIRAACTTVQGVNVVVGFSAPLWERIAPGQVPVGLAPFTTIDGVDGLEFPADQHDVWLWFHAAGPDAVFDAARHAAAVLAPVARVHAEHPGFTYQRSQDLTGFEDGTENPPVDEAVEVAVVPDGQPGEGGSVVLLQRWVHDLDGFATLPPHERELVIGRTLDGNEELPDDEQPPSSHVSRTAISDEHGDPLPVFRRSVAFGGVLEHGLVFVAFSADVARLERMLRRMAGLEDGVRDALTRFSRSTGAAWYVAPPADALA